jgi:hypothetical protein
VHKYADDCLATNHKISAREAYLRAVMLVSFFLLLQSKRVQKSEEHYQCGAPAISNQRIFDWLDETFAKTS